MPKLNPGTIKVHISLRDGDSKEMILQEGRNIPKVDGLIERTHKALEILVDYLKGGKP